MQGTLAENRASRQPLGRLNRIANNYLAQSYFLSGHVPGLMGSVLSGRINETASEVGGGWAGIGRVLQKFNCSLRLPRK